MVVDNYNIKNQLAPIFSWLFFRCIQCCNCALILYARMYVVSRWFWRQASFFCWGVRSSPRFPPSSRLGQWVWCSCQLLGSGALWWIWGEVCDGCCCLTSHRAPGQDSNLSTVIAKSCSVTGLSIFPLLCVLSPLFACKPMENCTPNTNHVRWQFKKLPSTKLWGMHSLNLVFASSSRKSRHLSWLLLGVTGVPQFSCDGFSPGDHFSALQGGPFSSHSWLPRWLTYSTRKKGNVNN